MILDQRVFFAKFNFLLLFFYLQRDALGKDLIKRLLIHLDLVEKDYFGLQYMDSKHVPVRIIFIFFFLICLLKLEFMKSLKNCLVQSLISRKFENWLGIILFVFTNPTCLNSFCESDCVFFSNFSTGLIQ